ncbi:MAG: DUF2141 domain-containing protein [Maribacter sp.]|uniref:DUF2141 domain-containing protein n=1 Tax=Maribacter sp. TaxID=1897614 RepID=UPI00329A708F
MIHLARMLLFLLVTVVTQAQEQSNKIEVEIHNIAGSEGQMLIGLYNSEANWLKKIYKPGTAKISDGKSAFVFTNIPDGVYAVSVFHDENNDGKLDTNFFGIPSEDTGSSNDAPARFGPPKWKDAKFELKGKNIKQIINL